MLGKILYLKLILKLCLFIIINPSFSNSFEQETNTSIDTNYYEKIIDEKNILINNLKNQLLNKNNNKNISHKSTQTDFNEQNDNVFLQYLKENIDESNIYESMDKDFISDLSDDNKSINETLSESTNNEMISSTKDIVLQKKLERQKKQEQEYNRKVNEILNDNRKDKQHYNYCTLDT